MDKLIAEYKKWRAALKTIKAADEREQSLINGMCRDMDYAIEWMETGRRPGSRRGIERLAAYQREIPTDIIEKYMKPTPSLVYGNYGEYEYMKMEFILSMLTDRERDCYEMHIAGLKSFREIAVMLDINFKTAHETFKRAERKVKLYKQRPLPTLLDLVV